jgi:molecular chaperone GrpE
MTDKSEEKTQKGAPKPKDAPEEAKPKTSKKEDELAKAKAEAESYLDMARRVQAEFENYRKRSEKENAEYRKFATSGLVSELLNIADDLEKALETVPDAEGNFATGIKAIRGNLMKILENQGVTEVPVDKGFDPNMHEALMVMEGDEDGKVAQVYQKGYLMNGRVLRTAKVVVTKKKEQEAAPVQDEKTADNEN